VSALFIGISDKRFSIKNNKNYSYSITAGTPKAAMKAARTSG
jgi:hypothetical protein